jgi:hypothetical protein
MWQFFLTFYYVAISLYIFELGDFERGNFPLLSTTWQFSLRFWTWQFPLTFYNVAIFFHSFLNVAIFPSLLERGNFHLLSTTWQFFSFIFGRRNFPFIFECGNFPLLYTTWQFCLSFWTWQFSLTFLNVAIFPYFLQPGNFRALSFLNVAILVRPWQF